MIKAEEIIDKIWAEHDHDKDDNYVYTDGWTDARDRFYQELQGKMNYNMTVSANRYHCSA